MTLLVSTNNYYNPGNVYYFVIKQKERVIYQDFFFNFTKNAANQRKEIPLAKLNLTNGGMLSANMYRVTNEYVKFQNLSGNLSFCDI